MEITDFQVEDREEFNQLMEDAWLDAYSENVLSSEEIRLAKERDFAGPAEIEYLENMEDYFARNLMDQGDIIGHFSVVGMESPPREAGKIALLYVHPDHQGEGYGSRAIEYAEKLILDNMNLGQSWVEVFAGNSSARGFYRGNGYRRTGSFVLEPERFPWLSEERKLEKMQKPL